MVAAIGVEPMTFRVWTERSSQLSYAAILIVIITNNNKYYTLINFSCQYFRIKIV